MAFLFRNGRVFDGTTPHLRDDVSVLVEDGVMREVADGQIRAADAHVIDLRGRTLMPGLIDAHYHAYAAEANFFLLDLMPRSLQALHARRFLEASLTRGFTTIRDVGGADFGLATACATGLIDGPRLLYCGRALSPTGGHGDSRPNALVDHFCGCCAPSMSIGVIADGVDEVRRAIRTELKKGAHAIKIMASGGVASPSDPIWTLQYSDEEIATAVWETSAWRTYVVAHAYTPESISRAVKIGVRSVEHVNLIDPPTARLMAEKGAFAVPTLVTYDALEKEGPSLGLPKESQAKLKVVREAGLRSLEILRDAGVQMGFGTDLLSSMHARQSDEFVIRREVLPASDILMQATSINARLIGREGALGVIAPGAVADLIIVDGDPIADIDVMTGQGDYIPFVMVEGEIRRNRLG